MAAVRAEERSSWSGSSEPSSEKRSAIQQSARRPPPEARRSSDTAGPVAVAGRARGRSGRPRRRGSRSAPGGPQAVRAAWPTGRRSASSDASCGQQVGLRAPRPPPAMPVWMPKPTSKLARWRSPSGGGMSGSSPEPQAGEADQGAQGAGVAEVRAASSDGLRDVEATSRRPRPGGPRRPSPRAPRPGRPRPGRCAASNGRSSCSPPAVKETSRSGSPSEPVIFTDSVGAEPIAAPAPRLDDGALVVQRPRHAADGAEPVGRGRRAVDGVARRSHAGGGFAGRRAAHDLRRCRRGEQVEEASPGEKRSEVPPSRLGTSRRPRPAARARCRCTAPAT